jgi:hypothetical protein
LPLTQTTNRPFCFRPELAFALGRFAPYAAV